jgi:hypothetical protein
MSELRPTTPPLPNPFWPTSWIEEACKVLRTAAIAQGVPGSALRLEIDTLLSGVPCPPTDLGFNSPADQQARRFNAAVAQSSEIPAKWQPMILLPTVLLRTEMLFKTERKGRDGLTHTSHEVLLVWPDGVLTDFAEAVVAPEEMPTHWMRIPQ